MTEKAAVIKELFGMIHSISENLSHKGENIKEDEIESMIYAYTKWFKFWRLNHLSLNICIP
ncbi:MAG: hypothetical protein R2941_03735 [Desulfobacterales bacterium]